MVVVVAPLLNQLIGAHVSALDSRRPPVVADWPLGLLLLCEKITCHHSHASAASEPTKLQPEADLLSRSDQRG